jgi:sigma-54 dependent transcriptional regulator, acetoin dehydrogenase operon transcriptional activator AcoR
LALDAGGVPMEKPIDKYIGEYTLRWFDMLSEGILISDENMVVRYVNAAFTTYAGLPAEYFLGHVLPEVRPGSKTPEVMRTKQPLYNVHRQFADGVESYVDILPLKENDAIIGSIVVVRDKKVLISMFKRLEEKNELISQLGQKLNHLFRVRYSSEDIIGRNAPFVTMAKKAATNESSVMLIGESGTGKEVLAQSIHGAGARKNGPFIDINCAALPEALLESELYGYATGTFTGADKAGKIGLFELANGGTIFLDEVTEMPWVLQGKLLRALEERQIRRLGGTKNIPLNVRIIAATNQDIESLVREGSFRADLFYRLAVFIIKIPPLRERQQDIPLFVQQYLTEYAKKNRGTYTFSPQALQALQSYSWPGNIRQLKNAIEYACDVAESNTVQYENLPGYIVERKDERFSVAYTQRHSAQTLAKTMEGIEKQILQNAIDEYGSGLEAKKKIADDLGISIATLYNKMRKFKLL